MKNYKFKFSFIILLLVSSISTQAQNYIKAPKGFTPQVGNLVSMLEDLKERITQSVEDMDTNAVDYLLDDKANSVGAMIMHLVATEKYYQELTFENRTFTEEEAAVWMMPLRLGEDAQNQIQGKPIKYYLKEWDSMRKQTLKLLKEKDDTWLNSKLGKADMNNHWAWYHVMEHQANHMGQIRLILKRAPQE
ncbi:Protein of unknown function [Gillisia sp. Hel1_33_143]|uniref:DinB family protein n=1 Tax=Gillisia sp. Hel1_33_143 TaxID=1336796 RepID=UPI00087D8B8E|nr:DUF664 domain-containing protein [Gillisia sp. Hel1_33_143]SDS40080.1 Protein of unknown function [Gillisia sp. Hel1_33_143]